MNPLTRKLVGAAIAIVAVGGLGSAAFAQSPVTTRPVPATKTTPGPSVDTDHVQQGDQTTPDKAETPDKTETPDKATDGPGGHQDPPGNVDNNQVGEN